jgi:hypothetical protein
VHETEAIWDDYRQRIVMLLRNGGNPNKIARLKEKAELASRRWADAFDAYNTAFIKTLTGGI